MMVNVYKVGWLVFGNIERESEMLKGIYNVLSTLYYEYIYAVKVAPSICFVYDKGPSGFMYSATTTTLGIHNI